VNGLIPILNRRDERILHALVLRRGDAGDRLMRSITHLGDTAVTVAITLLLALGAVPGLERIGREMAFVLVVSHLWVQLLKRTINRPRPRLPVGSLSLIDAPDRFSFPSGHAAASLSMALPLAGDAPGLLATAALLLASFVGISRCYLGVHYPGDVVMGWLLAIGAALLWGPFAGGVPG
jgi:undecaprenyl-diphosphatase